MASESRNEGGLMGASTSIATPASLPATHAHYPLVGVAAVVIAACASTLSTRITTFGIADIRGGLGLGFDEGSWLTSVFSAGQMLTTPAAAWLSTALGT